MLDFVTGEVARDGDWHQGQPAVSAVIMMGAMALAGAADDEVQPKGFTFIFFEVLGSG